MKITIDNARALAASLNSAAATAQAAGAADFDLLEMLSVADDDARTQLAAAITAASQASGYGPSSPP